MMKFYSHKMKGFTLLEMMLVLAIMSTILVMVVNLSQQKFAQFKRDKAALQIQQILNSALAYYASNGSWPVGTGGTLGNCATAGVGTLNGGQILQTSGFIQAINLLNPWFKVYQVSCNTTGGLNNFVVTTDTGSTSDALILAGELPIASVTGGASTAVTVQVPIPGQNLNNARAINFTGIYHTGGCVPVPTCPNGMIAKIIVFPASVNGVTTRPTGCSGNPPTCTTATAFPIEGFTAYATGTGTAASTPQCSGGGNAQCYADTTTGPWTKLTSGSYWRVCLQVQTSGGSVDVTSTSGNPGTSPTADDIYWASIKGTIIATTRCAPSNEVVGSSVNVWSN